MQTEIEAVSTLRIQPKQDSLWMLASLCAIALVGLGGRIHGELSNRWGVATDVIALGERLRQVPLELGDWRAREDKELSESTISLLECKGYLNRSYVHQGTGEVIAVAVMFGPKGPIAVHTPEVCYSSREVQQNEKRQAVSADYDGKENHFWKLSFSTNTLEKGKLSVMYAWSDGGAWQASEAPRFWATDYLYKIQTAAQGLGGKETSTDEFLRVFLPELRKQMDVAG